MRRSVVSLLAALFVSMTAQAQTIREATAAGPQANAQVGIQATVDAFRGDLGNPNNGNAVGSQGAGRRQITWDGSDSSSAPALMPGDFFNAVAPRGAICRGDARIQFQISADGVGNNPTDTAEEFGSINATYPTAFAVFSSPRLFSALNNNVVEVDFVVPGSFDPALVTGFGAVFTDVDTAGSTMIEFLDVDGEVLLARDVLATAGNESLSFLGVTFDAPVIRSVRITSGAAALGSNDITQGGAVDIVVMDDLIYGEPVAIPDADSDGALDPFDGCPDDPEKTEPGACGCGEPDTDSDSDGVADCLDGCPDDADKLDPGACGCGVADTDSDSDGVADCEDGCPDNAAKLAPGVCGCEEADTDSDGDSVPDCEDACPNDANKLEPGACGCDEADADSDGDGVADCDDQCPDDANKLEPGACGCGAPDTDADGDGVFDCDEQPSPDPNESADPNDMTPMEMPMCGMCANGVAMSSLLLLANLTAVKAFRRRRR